MPAVKAGDLVLLSGASGFLAIYVAQAALRHGLKVRGTVRSQAKGEYVKKVLNSKDFDFVIVEDVEQADAFDEAVKEDPLDLGAGQVEERILAETFVPLSWQRELWAIATYSVQFRDRGFGFYQDDEYLRE